jgi:signal transduction histidine kinase
VGESPPVLCKDIEPGLPVIRADKRRVRQIMLNLLSNAAKFTESGQIAVHARLIEALNADGERIEPFVEVSVIDTGVGIPEDKLVQVFEEFTQVDSSSTRRFEGTGLGLPITKKLVELHKGRIWVESEPGQGSVFTFTLPVNQPDVCDFEGDFSTEELKLEMKQEVEYEMAT